LWPLVERTWARTSALLLPFDWKRWWKLIVIVWLAGYFSGSAWLFSPNSTGNMQVQVERAKREARQRDKAQGEQAAPRRPQPTFADLRRWQAEQATTHLRLWVTLAGALAACWVLAQWLRARFNLILIDAVADRRVRIRTSFARHRDAARPLFRALLAIDGGGWLAMGLVSLGVVFHGAELYAAVPDLPLGEFALHHGGPLFRTFFLWMTVVWLLQSAASIWLLDLVAPQLGRPPGGFRHALEALRSRFDAGGYARFFLRRFVVSALLESAAVMVQVLVILAMGLVVGAAAAAAIGFAKWVPAAKPALLYGGGFLGILFGFAMLSAMAAVQMGCGVILRTFSLAYLEALPSRARP
jgi:hypothetical protein